MTEQQGKWNEGLVEEGRQVWIEPLISILSACDSEVGANPVKPEGAFAMGS